MFHYKENKNEHIYCAQKQTIKFANNKNKQNKHINKIRTKQQ